MIELYTDAATKGDPGPSYAGIYFKKTGEGYAPFLGEMSNHEAEFSSACYALRMCKDRYPGEILSLRTDSKIVVETFERGFSKNERFLPYLKELEKLQHHFSFVFMKWVPEKENKHADVLAKNALQHHLYGSNG